MRIKLLILKGETFADEIADLASDISTFQVVGFVVNRLPYTPGTTHLGLPVFWFENLPPASQGYQYLCGIATTHRWQFTAQIEQQGLPFATLIHPIARVSATARIGAGSIISAGAVIASYTKVGQHVLVNRGALIGHHTQIGEHVTIAPGANLGGQIHVARRAWIGIGATILEHTHIGESSLISAGAVVMNDVPARTQVMGNPARIFKTDIDGY